MRQRAPPLPSARNGTVGWVGEWLIGVNNADLWVSAQGAGPPFRQLKRAGTTKGC